MGRKVSDKFTVPIYRVHHRELHRRGSPLLDKFEVMCVGRAPPAALPRNRYEMH
jgi:hypothetical protein